MSNPERQSAAQPQEAGRESSPALEEARGSRESGEERLSPQERRYEKRVANAFVARDSAQGQYQLLKEQLESGAAVASPDSDQDQPQIPSDQRENGGAASELEEKIRDSRKELARANLELFKLGKVEKLSLEDVEVITQDMAESAQKSALSEMFLSGRGFKNFEEALRSLRLKGVDVLGESAALPDEGGLAAFWKSPAIQRVLKGMGISGGTSLAVAGVSAIFGGPVSWAVIGGGLAGGTAGRIAGELIRNKMLNRKEKEVEGKTIGFNEEVMKDLFSMIISARDGARRAQKEEDPQQKHKEMMDLILNMARAASPESGIGARYKSMDRQARLVSSALTIIGAIGGSVATAYVQHGAAAHEARELAREGGDIYNQQVAQTKIEGINIDLDGDSVKHTVKEVDGAYRFMLEQGDVAKAKAEFGKSYGEVLSYYQNPIYEGLRETGGLDRYEDLASLLRDFGLEPNVTGSVTEIIDKLPADVVPGQAGAEYFHSGVLDSNVVENIIRNQVSEQLQKKSSEIIAQSLTTNIASAAIAAGPTVAYEAVTWQGKRKSEETIRADNARLIDSHEDLRQFIRDRLDFGYGDPNFNELVKAFGDPWPHKNETGRIRQWFDHVARRPGYASIVPEGPEGYRYDWVKQPQTIPKKEFSFEKVPTWVINEGVDPETGERIIGRAIDDTRGGFIEVAVAGVDLEKNKIAIVMSEAERRTGAVLYPVELMRVDEFMRRCRPIIRQEFGRPGQGQEQTESSPSGSNPEDDNSRPALGEPQSDANEGETAGRDAEARSKQPRSEKKDGPNNVETLKLPEEYDQMNASERFDLLNKTLSKLDSDERQDTSVSVGSIRKGQDKVDFITFKEQDGTEKTLHRYPPQGDRGERYDLTVVSGQEEKRRSKKHGATQQSIEIFTKQLFKHVNTRRRDKRET